MNRLSKRSLALCLLAALGACSSSAPADDSSGSSGLATGTQADLSDLTKADLSPKATRDKTSAEGAGEVVATDALPENLRAILDAWRTGGFVWEVKRGEVLSDPKETEFLVNNLLLLLFDEARAMRNARSAREADPSQRRSLERAKSELRLCGPQAAAALAETLGLGDDMLSALSIDVLGGMGADAAPAVSKILDRDAALVRYSALQTLSRLPGAGPEEASIIERMSEVAREDRSEIVRVAAVQALGERGLFSQAGKPAERVDFLPWALAIVGALKDSASAVRIEALRSLSMLGDDSVVSDVIAFGRTAVDRERTEARRTLESLTGQKWGTNFQAWQTWLDSKTQAAGN